MPCRDGLTTTKPNKHLKCTVAYFRMSCKTLVEISLFFYIISYTEGNRSYEIQTDKNLKFEITVPALAGYLAMGYSFIRRSVRLVFRFIIH